LSRTFEFALRRDLGDFGGFDPDYRTDIKFLYYCGDYSLETY